MEVEKCNYFDNIQVLLFYPTIHRDDRGLFFESFNEEISSSLREYQFFQDSHSISSKNVVRGLHYQWEKPMGKLVRVVHGMVRDVIVDIRQNSSTYGKHKFFDLSAANNKILWIPPGFAHGFISLEDNTQLLYRCSSYYNGSGEGVIDPFDRDISVEWGRERGECLLSSRDQSGISFEEYDKEPKFKVGQDND